MVKSRSAFSEIPVKKGNKLDMCLLLSPLLWERRDLFGFSQGLVQAHDPSCSDVSSERKKRFNFLRRFKILTHKQIVKGQFLIFLVVFVLLSKM